MRKKGRPNRITVECLDTKYDYLMESMDLKCLSPITPYLHLHERNINQDEDAENKLNNELSKQCDQYIEVTKRCDNCGEDKKLNKVYCFSCFRSLEKNIKLPNLQLPIQLDIIKHPHEKLAKSTAIHPLVITQDQKTTTYQMNDDKTILCDCRDTKSIGRSPTVTLYPSDVPPCEDHYDPEATLVIFPSEQSKRLQDYPVSILNKIDTVVVLDGTWYQVKSVIKNVKALSSLKYHVHLEDRRTLFWRVQGFGDHYLSTVEAVFYFYKEFYEANSKKKYDGRYDNILYLFVAQFVMIRNQKRKLIIEQTKTTEKNE